MSGIKSYLVQVGDQNILRALSASLGARDRMGFVYFRLVGPYQ